jgi:oligopeptide transport system substrate-binding protein
MQQSKKCMKSLALPFLALVSILIVACSPMNQAQPKSATKASPDKQVFIMPLAGGSDINTFDPALAGDALSISSIDNVFTGLVEFNRDLNIVPQLAASYRVSTDGLAWTFTLKPALKFSNGTPLTSHDVVYSIDRALQPATKSAVAPIYLNLIKDSDKLVAGKLRTIIGDSLLTPDDRTVVIITNKRVFCVK